MVGRTYLVLAKLALLGGYNLVRGRQTLENPDEIEVAGLAPIFSGQIVNVMVDTLGHTRDVDTVDQLPQIDAELTDTASVPRVQ